MRAKTERWRDRQMMKLVVAFHSLANAPKNEAICRRRVSECFETISGAREEDLEYDPSTGRPLTTLEQKTLKISCEVGARDRQMT